jgi:hypothetical protein
LTLDDLLAAFRSAEMRHHPRVADQLLEEREVSLPPGLEADGESGLRFRFSQAAQSTIEFEII